jgi:outer membrane receptor protein involved in Fe transport
LALGGTLSYVDSEDVDTGLTTLRSPEWNGNVRIDYGRPFQNTSYTWNTAAQVFYRDGYFNTPGVTFNSADSRSVLDLRLGIEHESGWNVALIGKNVTDEINCGHGSFSSLFGQGPGLQLSTLERPRTIALEGRYNF